MTCYGSLITACDNGMRGRSEVWQLQTGTQVYVDYNAYLNETMAFICTYKAGRITVTDWGWGHPIDEQRGDWTGGRMMDHCGITTVASLAQAV